VYRAWADLAKQLCFTKGLAGTDVTIFKTFSQIWQKI
jgi:hypothetical protein